jgi:putative aminopeptidase FrvX
MRTHRVPVEGQQVSGVGAESRNSLHHTDGEGFEPSIGYSPIHAFQASSRKRQKDGAVACVDVNATDRPESQPTHTIVVRTHAYPARTRVVGVVRETSLPRPLQLGGGNTGVAT